jgi:hypothetical protein
VRFSRSLGDPLSRFGYVPRSPDGPTIDRLGDHDKAFELLDNELSPASLNSWASRRRGREGGPHVLLRFTSSFCPQRSSQAVDLEEIEANDFVAELSMPTAILKEDLSGADPDHEDDELTPAPFAASSNVGAISSTAGRDLPPALRRPYTATRKEQDVQPPSMSAESFVPSSCHPRHALICPATGPS